MAFGFVDNTVPIHAGDAIDASVGVTFGLSSLAAAAMGQIASDTSGVLFGSTIENAALRLGFAAPAPGRRRSRCCASRSSPAPLGKVLGVITGCSLGLVNLLFVDTLAVEKAKEEKEYTAIFRAIMHRGHEAAERAAAARGSSTTKTKRSGRAPRTGTKKSDVTVRRPFGVGIVGAVAESGQLSNVSEAYAHPRFDRTVDKDGITGSHEPVAAHRAGVRRRRARRRRRAAREQKARRRRPKGKGRKDDAQRIGVLPDNRERLHVPNPAGVDAEDSALRGLGPDDDNSHWEQGWVPAKVTRRVELEVARARRTEWWRRFSAGAESGSTRATRS